MRFLKSRGNESFYIFRQMKFDVFSIVVLLGALQALFFSIYLFFLPSRNKIQNRALAFFIFILSYNGFETLNWSSGLFKHFPFFEFCSFILVFGLGPCIYLYVRSFRAISETKKAWPHFLIIWPMLFCRLWILVTWLLQVNGREVLIDAGMINDWFCAIAEPLSVIVFTIYLIFAVREYRCMVRDHVQNGGWTPEEKESIARWLKKLLIVMGMFSVLWTATVGLPFIYDTGNQNYYVIEVALVVFIYWIGYAGYYRSRIIYVSEQRKTSPYIDHLKRDEIERSLSALSQAMEKDKLYLDPELNLNSLAAYIGVQPKTLSAVLNQVLQKGFSEYVNTWRVEAVKEMILDPDKRHLTLTGIAYDCGFSSQPTFQRAFKSITGLTPRDYLQNSIQIQN